MIEIKNLVVKVDDKLILNGVDLTINPGEVVAIMGSNGSGKSTLAYAIAGHPKYEVEGDILVDKINLEDKSPDERAKMGIFLANQYPVAIFGLTVNSFLWQVYKKRRDSNEIASQSLAMTLTQFRKHVEELAADLNLNLDLLKRSLNDGFSGGEKKKLEILQLLVFSPKYLILDEIDSGLDVDALRIIAETVAKVAKEKKMGVLVITHYNRILKYLKPDKVVIMDKGKIVKTGTGVLAEEIEASGYKKND